MISPRSGAREQTGRWHSATCASPQPPVSTRGCVETATLDHAFEEPQARQLGVTQVEPFPANSAKVDKPLHDLGANAAGGETSQPVRSAHDQASQIPPARMRPETLRSPSTRAKEAPDRVVLQRAPLRRIPPIAQLLGGHRVNKPIPDPNGSV